MKKKAITISSVILMFLLSGLGAAFILKHPKTIKEEYTHLMSTHSKTYREIRRNGYVIGVNYLPMRFFELRNLMTLGANTSSEQKQDAIADARRYNDNGIYFLVTIAFDNTAKDIMNVDIANFSEWSENLQKFHFRMGEYIYLKTAQDDEIKLSVYDFQNSFGYTKDRKMLLCFPKEFNGHPVLSDDSKYIRMVFKEWGWGIGKQKIEWDTDEISED